MYVPDYDLEQLILYWLLHSSSSGLVSVMLVWGSASEERIADVAYSYQTPENPPSNVSKHKYNVSYQSLIILYFTNLFAEGYTDTSSIIIHVYVKSFIYTTHIEIFFEKQNVIGKSLRNFTEKKKKKNV